MTRQQKIWIFLGVLFGFIAIVIIISMIFSSPSDEPDVIEPTGVDIGDSILSTTYTSAVESASDDEVSTKSQVQPEQVSDDTPFYMIRLKDSNAIRYVNRATGELYEYSIESNSAQRIASDIFIENDVQVIWSPTGDALIGIENDRAFHLNLETGVRTDLNPNIRPQTIEWTPDGSKITYLFADAFNNQRSITIANPDGTGFETFLEIDTELFGDFERDVVPGWSPDGAVMTYQLEATDVGGSEVFGVNAETDEVVDLTNWGEAFGYLYSPDSSKVLMTRLALDSPSPELWVSDAIGEGERNLEIEAAVEKCVWKNDNVTIVCALANELYAFSEGQERVSDVFVAIDTNTTAISLLSVPSSEGTIYDAYNLMLSEDERTLYFLNYTDFKLNSIPIE